MSTPDLTLQVISTPDLIMITPDLTLLVIITPYVALACSDNKPPTLMLIAYTLLCYFLQRFSINILGTAEDNKPVYNASRARQ